MPTNRQIRLRRDRIKKNGLEATGLASRALRLQREVETYRDESAALARSSPVEGTSRVIAWVVASAAAGVYFIDVILFGSTIESIVGQAFHQNPQAILVAKWLFPLAIVALELAFACHLHLVKQRAEESDSREDWRALWAWRGIGLILVIVMPAVAFAAEATAVSNLAINYPGDVSGLYARAVGLSAIALVAHVFVIFGGRTIIAAKNQILDAFNQARLEGRVRRTERARDRAAEGAVTRISDYVSDLNEFNSAHPDRAISAGPFPADVIAFFNERFGYAIFEQAPNSSGTREPRPAPQPVPRPETEIPNTMPADEARGDGAELRSMIANAESEISPD